MSVKLQLICRFSKRSIERKILLRFFSFSREFSFTTEMLSEILHSTTDDKQQFVWLKLCMGGILVLKGKSEYKKAHELGKRPGNKSEAWDLEKIHFLHRWERTLKLAMHDAKRYV